MRMILFLPAVVATLGAVFLVVVFAGIPAASSTEYLNAGQPDAAAADGDLVVLGGVNSGQRRRLGTRSPRGSEMEAAGYMS